MGKTDGKPIRVASISLVVVGATLLSLTIFMNDALNIALPLVFLMLGGAFYIRVFAARDKLAWASVLYIPGSFLLALGTILLLNVLTNDWKSWAYAWLLLLAGSGIGIILASREQFWKPFINLIGWGMAILGITFFAVFGEIAGGLFIKIMAPVMLILGGVLLYSLRVETILPETVLRQLHLIKTPADETGMAFEKLQLPDPLSARELEVLQLIDEGFTNQQIAFRLNVATSTVKTHINNIYSKLDVQTRVQAVNRARELGLLDTR